MDLCVSATAFLLIPFSILNTDILYNRRQLPNICYTVSHCMYI